MLAFVFVGIATFLPGVVIGILLTQSQKVPVPPFIDRGHRLFGVQNRHARDIIEHILYEHGVRRSREIDFGPTHQVLMADNQTVLCDFDEGDECVPIDERNAISLVCKMPITVATNVRDFLVAEGFRAEIKYPSMNHSDILCMVKTNALTGSVLVFRRHAFVMGKKTAE